MAFPCPRCGDRYTQSLPMAYGSGTYVRNWRSRSGYSGTTVSQSIIGNLASPPVKRSEWKPALALLFVCLMSAPTVAAAWSQWIAGPEQRTTPAPIVDGPKVRHRHARQLMTLQPRSAVVAADHGETLLTMLGIGLALGGLMFWWLTRSIRYNRTVYPQLYRNWQISFMCKQCGAVFYPPDAANLIVSP